MSNVSTVPEHVPAELVREFNLNFKGPLEEMFPRFDALRDEGRALWINTSFTAATTMPGFWLFTQIEDIRDALQDASLFSSVNGNVGDMPNLIPIFMDPPDHTKYRRLLTPIFSLKVIRTMEASIKERVVGMIDEIAARGECEFVGDFAVEFPTRVFTSWLGLPEDETPKFVKLVSTLIHDTGDGEISEEERGLALMSAVQVLNDLIDARMAKPTDDLMSQIVIQEIDGRPLTKDELMGIAFLLFLAGLDTVAAALSFAFSHLGQSSEHREGLANGTISTDDMVEETLRRHSFVNLTRTVSRDAEFAGVQLKKGDVVITSLAMASRDPAEFANPTEIVLGRETNRHAAFGLGAHRCLGSHLARIEMKLALEEWHARIPDYHISGDVESYSGGVMGVRKLPLKWA